MSEPLPPAWIVPDADYPFHGGVDDQLRYALRYAVLAPSSHNTQPWLFHVEDGVVSLYADRARALPVADPHDRELTLSCGAALYVLRLALRHFGHRGDVELLPDPADPDLLARVRPGPNLSPSVEEEHLFAAIPRRRTNRRPFEARAVPGDLLIALGEAAAAEGAWVRVLSSSEQKHAVAELVAEGDRAQLGDPSFRRELAAWLRPNRALRPRHDGMPGSAQGLGDVASLLGPLVVRTFDVGDGQAARDAELATGSPALLVLGTQGDDARDWLQAGQALARLLLRARVREVDASYLNQPVEIGALRARLATLVEMPGAHPQMVLRLGFGPDVQPTPRRALDEVLVP